MIQQLLRVNQIYERRATSQLLIYWITAIISAPVLLLLVEPVGRRGLTALFATWTLILGFLLFQTSRAVYIGKLLARRRYVGKVDVHHQSQILKSAINNEYERIDVARVVEQDHHWQIYDAIFNIYDESKSGKPIKIKQAFYSVFEAKLRRAVPNLIFDSQAVKGRQFKSVYLKAQKLSFDYHLDEHFQIYSPKNYEIDTLSIITPEVIEALVMAKDYDIEFVGDSLFCYAPLLPKNQLEAFKQRALSIYDSVNDNLESYRDERLSGQPRRKQVSDFGRRLLDSPVRYLKLVAASVIVIIASLAFMIAFPDLPDLGVYVLCFAATSLMTALPKAVNIIRTNKQREEAMTASHGPILVGQPSSRLRGWHI